MDRQSLKQKASVSFSDGVSKGTSDYYAAYEFVAPGLVVPSSVHVLEHEEAAKRAALELHIGAENARRARGVSADEVQIPPGYDFFGKILVVRTATGELAGNAFYLWRGRNVYQLTVGGAGAFVDPSEAAHFVASKAEALLSFEPDFGDRTAESAMQVRSERRSMTLPLLFLYVLAYFAGKSLGWVVARMRGRTPSRGRVWGVVGVVGAACTVATVMLSSLNRAGMKFQRLSPFDQGLLEGEIMTASLAPALLVLIGVAIVAIIKR